MNLKQEKSRKIQRFKKNIKECRRARIVLKGTYTKEKARYDTTSINDHRFHL